MQINRRTWLGVSSSIAALTMTQANVQKSYSQITGHSPTLKPPTLKPPTLKPPTLKPPMLKVGDRVGMVAPASNVYEPEDLRIAQETMEQYGFEIVLGQHIQDQYGYLAGQDRDRAADLNVMFGRSDIKGIVTFSGGYGCCRLLPYLDYELIRKNPKVLIGHSDITSLLIAIYEKTGLMTFHGPSGLTRVGDYAMNHIRRTIMSKTIPGITAAPEKSDSVERDHRLITLNPGRATGALIGGNLTLVTNLLGTPYEPDTKGKILFLEEVGEEPYRIDRMLTQLLLAGKLQDAVGIAFGHFTDCYPKDHLPTFTQTLSLETVLRDRTQGLNKPILYNLMFGHLRQNAVLPIGAIATLDATGKTLTLNESAVT
jgi:muramoyltetrapeptide carboxypeptidase